MGELEAAFEEAMNSIEKPGEQGVLASLRWNRVWQGVSKSAAKVANKSIRQHLLAFDGASVSRDSSGRFSKLAVPDHTSKLARWWTKLTDRRTKSEIAKHWEPLEATKMGSLRRTPYIILQVKALEIDRLDIDANTEDDITDAVAEAMTVDTSWIGPVVNDAANPKSFYQYGNIA